MLELERHLTAKRSEINEQIGKFNERRQLLSDLYDELKENKKVNKRDKKRIDKLFEKDLKHDQLTT